MPAGAGRHSRDSELLTKIDLACPEIFQNYNIPENCARDTHPVPWVQLGTVHKPSWKCPHSWPGSLAELGTGWSSAATTSPPLCPRSLSPLPWPSLQDLNCLSLALPSHASATDSPMGLFLASMISGLRAFLL